MIWLSNSTLARLRDQLLESGGRPSSVGAPTEDAVAAELQAEYAPLCEAMYLMMAADGEVGGVEREVLRGALRNLSGSGLRTADIEGFSRPLRAGSPRRGGTRVFAPSPATSRAIAARAEVASSSPPPSPSPTTPSPTGRTRR